MSLSKVHVNGVLVLMVALLGGDGTFKRQHLVRGPWVLGRHILGRCVCYYHLAVLAKSFHKGSNPGSSYSQLPVWRYNLLTPMSTPAIAIFHELMQLRGGPHQACTVPFELSASQTAIQISLFFLVTHFMYFSIVRKS